VTTPARRRALLVGIGRYQDSRFTDLPGVAVDLKIVREVLGDAGIGAFDVVEQVSDSEVATLRGRVADFLERSEPDELTVLYVSGHGVRSPATGEFHFVASDTDRDRLSETAVPADYLNELLEGCRAGQKVVILDCCESGGFTAGFTTTRRAKSSESVGAPVLTKGVYVLASSQALEASWAGETPESPSLFTGEIVSALRSGAGDRDRDGRIGVAELYEHVNAVLKARPKESRQTPVVSSLGVSGTIYLAKAPARRTDPRGGRRAGAKSADGFAAPQGSGPVNWKTLLGYYADCVRAENTEDKVLRFTPGQPGIVCVGGSEQLLSGTGAGADGLFPVPEEFAGHIDEAVKNGSDLAYGYPVLVLLRDADGKNRKIPECAPLLVRRLEIVQSDDGSVWLRPYGEPEPNPALSKDRLGAEDAENLLRTYIPTWGADDHVGMSREINHLLRDVFELPWIDEIRPDRLATNLDTTGSQSGARNAAVLMALDSAGTVRQLLRDLEDIAEKETSIGHTALGCLLDGSASAGTGPAADPVVIGPMNDGQGDVLNAAMSRRLTVATGPPGTGKSSLIVNLVATAVAAGQTVLVASTNNTAVDEVWHRCTAIIDGLIVRTGSKGNGDGTNYRAAERQTLQDASAVAGASGGRSLTTAQAAYAMAMRDHDAAKQAIAEKGSTEAALLATGRQRAQALDDIGANRSAHSGGHASGAGRLVGASDSELIRLRTRSDKLGRARWFATGRRQRFLGRLGIASTAHNAKTLCGVVGAYAESETTWRALSIRPHADDAVLTTDLAAADDKRRAEALVLLKAKLQSLRAARRTALQALADHTDNSSSDWGKLRAALPAVPGWAVTCLSARRFPPNPGMFDLVIIDEASQCSIPAVLPVLFRAKRAVVIGDPLQLPHVATLKADVEATIREGHGFGPQQLLDQHLAYRQDSAFHALEDSAAGSFTLAEHYRCHPDIARLADNLFYAPRGKPLTILTPSQLLRGVPDQPSVRWIDQPGTAMRHENGSWVNQAEVERANVGVRYFLDKLPSDAVIGVVTPFKAQAAAIRSTWSGEKQRVRVGTAHSFQGGECDAVIYSLVAADGISSGALSFLDDQANLWNVAITRARAHLFVIGDHDFWIRRGGLGLKLMNQVESSRQNPDWPHGDELRDLLYARLATSGNVVDLAETRAGYLADAVVTAADGTETAIVLDTGPPSGGDDGRSLLLHTRRTALLESVEEARHAQRLPAWRLYDEAD
jgi:hypothetical protein